MQKDIQTNILTEHYLTNMKTSVLPLIYPKKLLSTLLIVFPTVLEVLALQSSFIVKSLSAVDSAVSYHDLCNTPIPGSTAHLNLTIAGD